MSARRTLSRCIQAESTSLLFSAHLISSDPDVPPRNLNVTSTSTSLRIQWEAPAVLAGPTSYFVQVTC